MPNTVRDGTATILPEPGATAEWHRQLRAGLRTRYDFDALWRASCAELNGRDALQGGLPTIANQYRQQAAVILLEAATASAA